MQRIDYDEMVKIKEEMIDYIIKCVYSKYISAQDLHIMRADYENKSFRSVLEEYAQERERAAIEDLYSR